MPLNKMGRPPADNPKTETLRVRVDKETVKKLDDCASELETTRSEIVRKGIDLVVDTLKK
jgi:predicted transcriptional regulator